MQYKNICQSCSMPLTQAALLGTEKNGSKNQEYCIYCYQHGAFVNPAMTLAEMTALVKTQMENMKMEPDIIDIAIASLPSLKRWKTRMSSL